MKGKKIENKKQEARTNGCFRTERTMLSTYQC